MGRMSDLDIQLREHYNALVRAGFHILRPGGQTDSIDEHLTQDEFVMAYAATHFGNPAGAGKVDLVRIGADGKERRYNGVNIRP